MRQAVKLRLPLREVPFRRLFPRAAAPVAALAATAALLAGCEKPKPVAPPPPNVKVMTVQPQDAPITQTWVATLTGDVNADIRAQVSGYLQSQNYVNGAYVKAGQLLFQIDPRPFEAQLAEAQGALAQAQAQNTANELTAQRAVDLYKKNVISRQQYDDQTQAYESSKAAVQAAQASVQAAQLSVTFTRITAPVDGLTSIATAQVGDLVGPSSGTLATVVKIDPIKVQFMVPEQGYVKFISQYFKDPEKSPINTGHRLSVPLSLSLADGTKYPMAGELTSVNNVVGIDTGSISMEGEFPNPGKLLRPGQFGLVTAVTHVDKGAMVIPQRAVINLQGITEIAVVGDGNKVTLKTVALGRNMGDDVIVTSGLNAGDTIVVEGVQKVQKDGTVVVPEPYTETAQEKASDVATPVATPTATPATKG
jgi:membrane fusion protein (multidrug efflux system)